MAALVRLDALILQVRRLANIESQAAFITDLEITSYLNAGLSELYDKLCSVGGQEWYRDSRSFSTSSSTDTYPLADIAPNFYRLISVDVLLSASSTDTDVITARPFMEPERNRYKMGPGWRVGYPVYYRLEGQKIVFIPKPPGTFTIRLNYFPTFIPLVNSSDTFDAFQAGWEEYAIFKAVAYCKAKGDEDPSFALSMIAALDQRITDLAGTRDAGAPERVNDVMGQYERGWWY